ncbi:O-antigen ligase family protein [Bacillus sp. KH172YL63]|uniref:O-antigen ligase family protein n=1 Tax=Bacillus sp. KH172YL63 TaxID=2709784 RepID=UPI0015674C00|nr:O-antigen ligase family protein [Bacillus sp. KH172YL63]
MKLFLLINLTIIYSLGLGFSSLLYQVLFFVLLIINSTYAFYLFLNRPNKKSYFEVNIFFLLIIVGLCLISNGNSLADFISYFLRIYYYITLFYIVSLYTSFENERSIEILKFLMKITMFVSMLSLILYILFSEPLYLNINGSLYSILIEQSFFGKNIISGPFIAVNEFGDLQVFLLLFSLVGIQNKIKFSKISFVLSIILVIMTISRTSIFLSLLIFLAYLFIEKKIKPVYVYLSIYLFGLIIIIQKFINVFYFLGKFNQTELFSGREELWRASKIIISNHFFMGTPISQIRNLYDSNLPASLQGLGAHNMYLHLMVITGVLGFIAIMTFLLYIFVKAGVRKNKQLFFISFSLVLLVFIRGITESGILFIFSLRTCFVWILLGIIFSWKRGKI